jgi:hypothetical protein
MNLTITTATLDGIDLQDGDEIGIFDGEVCVGSGIVDGTIETPNNMLAIVASAQESSWPEGTGFASGNSISYRFWDANEGKEITSVQADYLQGDEVFTNQGSAYATLAGSKSIEQSIDLTNGWNIISFNMFPDTISMEYILSGLIDEGSLVKVQSETGAAIEYVSFLDTWSNNIGDMSITEGYYVKVNMGTTLTAIGVPYLPSHNTPL